MTDESEISSRFYQQPTTSTVNPPLFTCGLKLDKNDYEKKVRDNISTLCFLSTHYN
mgnify:FL=1